VLRCARWPKSKQSDFVLPTFDEGIRWLSCEDLIGLNRKIIQETTPDELIRVHDMGALESAQCAPAQHRFYVQTEDVFILAAILLCRIVTNHPFQNANKRTAFSGARNFLWLNGYEFNPPLEETEELCVGVAQHDYDEEQVAYWISMHTVSGL